MSWTMTYTDDSATIGSTEYFLASDSTTATYQTSKVDLQVVLDLNALAAGDLYQISIYDKANSGTARCLYRCFRGGVQTDPNWVSPAFKLGGSTGGWEVSVKKISGTDRSIPWSLRKTIEV